MTTRRIAIPAAMVLAAGIGTAHAGGMTGSMWSSGSNVLAAAVCQLVGGADCTMTGDILFEGSVADGFETTLTVVNPTADRTVTLPNATITVNAAADISGTTLAAAVVTTSITTVGALGSGSISSGFGAIDNGADAITTTGLCSIGSLYSLGDLVLEGTTANDFETTLTATDPTADRTITFGDATGTVCTSAGGCAFGASNTYAADDITDADVSNTLTASLFVGSGSTTTAVDLATAEVSGEAADANVSNTLTSSLFVGSGSTTTAIDLATAEVAGVLPSANIDTGVCLIDNSRVYTGNAVYEGATANDFETTLAITDPTADRTWTFADASGTVNAAADISGTTLAASVVTTSITTVGALAGGSIASGFGAIDTGADAITTSGTIGTASTTTFTGAGATLSAALAANGGITFDGADSIYSTSTAAGLNLAIASAANAAGENGVTMGTNDVSTTGVLVSFSTDVDGTPVEKARVEADGDVQMDGACTIDGAATVAGALAANGGITFDAATDTIGSFTFGGVVDAANNLITNIGAAGVDFVTGGQLNIRTDGSSTFLTMGTAGSGMYTFDSSQADIRNQIINGTGSVTIADAATVTGALAANGGITFDASTDTVGAHTAAGTYDMSTQILTNVGNAGTDFVPSTGALTLAGILTANGGTTTATAKFSAHAETALTVAATTTPTGSWQRISGVGAVAWVPGTTSITDGMLVDACNVDAESDVITMTDGSTYEGSGCALGINDCVRMRYDSTATKWREISCNTGN